MTESNFIPPEVDDLNEQMPAFEFVSRLATDDCKAVYLAKQKSLERRAAIKFYSPDLSRSPDFRKSFAETTKLMAKLKHPNLIGVYDSGFEMDMLYLVTEFVAGKPLWNSTKGKPVHVKHVQTLVEGICVGMCHAHKNDICHGALSLKNILLDETHMPKIGGFSQASGDTSKLDPSALRFRAPELADEGAEPTPQCDVYSIGVILREMAVGQTEGVEALADIEQIGPALKRLVEKATSLDPSRRHRKLEDFYAELLDAFDPSAQKKPSAGMMKTGAVKLTSPVKLQPVGASGGPKSGGPSTSMGRAGGPASGLGKTAGASKAVMPVKPSSPAKLWLHLVVIVVLLIAIKVAWSALKEKKERNSASENIVVPPQEFRVVHTPRAPKTNPVANRTHETGHKDDGIDEFPNDPDPNAVAPAPKRNAIEELSRLRFSLSRGSRSEMPEGTVQKGEHYFYHVNEAMTWDEAFWYAEAHGGHLAIPGPKATAIWMREQVVSNDGMPFWVGAAKSGRHSWTLADGRPWRPKDPSVSLGEYVAVGPAGELRGQQGDIEREFVIQWHRDGTNPGSLEALLEITAQSLSTSTPIYPPGTRAFGVRNYLYVPRETTWKKAVLSARAGGGNLMVVGGIAEKFNIEKMTADVDADEGIWLGGFHLAGKGWRWTTGEPWRSSEWPQSKPPEVADAALLMQPGGAWSERSRDGEASGYLIEWSDDHEKASR